MSRIKQGKDGRLYISESDIQCNSVRWFRIAHSKYEKHLLSIPNGGYKVPKETRIRLVREGLLDGAHDLFLSLPRSGYHGMYLEMKTPDGKVEDDQRAFSLAQIAEGYAAVYCRSRDDFEHWVTLYMESQFQQAFFMGWEKKSEKKSEKVTAANK